MNILICDDIREETLQLEKAIKESSGIDAEIRYFEKAQDVLEYIKTDGKIDVCFLDIVMPEMNGIELARALRAANFNGKIIFLTTSNEYGSESYQVKAYSYLLKPINVPDVAGLLSEIINSPPDDTQKRQAGIKIEARNMTRFVYFHEISYVEVIDKNVYFRLLDGNKIMIYASLKDILPQLMADDRFSQCHRSFVVNMDAIKQIQGKEIIFKCGRKAPISKNYSDFNKHYSKWIFESWKKEI
ncbi:MAG: LytTR family DNA-binding domain-containing protein, partial [Leptospirales bacterium]|nr:LytTR family DNA-binding domain-containing protein [Leptospirales bacterium]